MLERGGAVGKAQRLFDRGDVAEAALVLWGERKRAADDNETDRLAEIDEVSSEMRERLEGDNRLPAFDAHLSGREAPAAAGPAVASQDEEETVDVSPLSLGIALVGAGLMLIAVFLPQFESNAFAQIEKNTLIQNGGGWWFILLAVLSAGAAYRAFHQQRRTFAPVVFGVIGIAVAVYYGAAHSQRRLCSAASSFTSNCTLGTPSIGIYAAGVGAFLVVVGGWQMFRADRIEVEDEDEDETVEPQPVAAAPASIADRLRALDQLKAEGLITDAEHSERRAAVLEQV